MQAFNVPSLIEAHLDFTPNPHAMWITQHGSLEGCCGCDCHCADCGGACGPCPIDSVDSVSNGMVFKQVDDQSWFIIDTTQTYGSPDPPKTGATENFVIGGLWLTDTYLDHLNFQCRLFGALVYNEDFPITSDVTAGGWTHTIPFDVPSVAPQTTYYITVNAYDADGAELFVINTDFKF